MRVGGTSVIKNCLWQLVVTTSIEAEEAVTALLERLIGNTPAVYADAETQVVTVSAYCPNLPRPEGELRMRLRTGLRQLKNCGLDAGRATVSFRKVRPQDWAESWKRHFRPIEIGGALLVKPSWSGRRPRAGQAVVVLDPGLSFGTGQHPTTAFCLEQLTARRVPGRQQSFLDIGTGSGILAIAAAKLGYQPVQAFDTDPAAVRVARKNATQNRVARRLRIHRQDLIRLPIRGGAKFDVVCANLTSDLLVPQAKRVVNRLQPTGRLILAGILQTQFAEVTRTYAARGLKLIATAQKREWQSAAFAFRR
jgi:ribosomal protein L11 methyltransferase